MDNATKALIVAGVIIVCVLIVAVGMYVYKTSASSIEDTMSTMSTHEIESYNSKYTMYEGEQSGSNVKSLVGILISNVKNSSNEKNKIPGMYFENKDDRNIDSGIPENGENDDYLTALQNIRKNVEAQHKYWIEVNYQSNGLVDYINISYSKEDIIEPMKRN